MKKPDRKTDEQDKKNREKSPKEKDKKERKIDDQIEESFPASDTPSHVQPGSKPKKGD